MYLLLLKWKCVTINQDQWDASWQSIKLYWQYFLTMNKLYNDSEFREKLQLFYHSIFCHLNYTQFLVLSDLAMQRLFNDDFQLLFRIYWELWCELPTQIAFKHLSLFHIRKRGDGRHTGNSRCVLSAAVQTIYCSQKQARKDRGVAVIIGECYSVTRSPTFIWPRFGQNSGIDLELIKTLVQLSHLRGNSLICQSPSL